MAEISTRKILDGITVALHKKWPEAQIYGDEVSQGLSEGGFNVILISSEQKQDVGERYKRTPLFDVLYYPKEGREECYEIADELSGELKLIALPDGDYIRGTDVNFEVVDGVLHFYVRFTHYVRRVETAETMETLQITGGQ